MQIAISNSNEPDLDSVVDESWLYIAGDKVLKKKKMNPFRVENATPTGRLQVSRIGMELVLDKSWLRRCKLQGNTI